MHIYSIFGISKCMTIWAFNSILSEVCNCDEKGWGWGFPLLSVSSLDHCYNIL